MTLVQFSRGTMGKRKSVQRDAAGAATAKKGHGGAGRGQGNKAKGVNTPGFDKKDGPKRVQATLADLLGPRFDTSRYESAMWREAGLKEPL